MYIVTVLLFSSSSFFFYRCRDSERTDSYLPCTLALFNVYLQIFKQDYIGTIKVCILYISIALVEVTRFDVLC